MTTPPTPHTSRVYVSASFTAKDLDAGYRNVTALPVYMAFMTGDNQPTDSDAHTAVWGTYNSATGAATVNCLIGPGGAGATQLAVGHYSRYIKIVDNPEIPWILVEGGLLVIE